MTNKNDTLAFNEYPAIKYLQREKGDYLIGSDLEPMFVFSAFGALILKVVFAHKKLPNKITKKLQKKLKPFNNQKLTFEHHDKHIEQIINDAITCELAVCKFHNESFRYVNVTAIGNYSHYSNEDAVRYPVSRKHFGDFLSIVEDFTCKLREDGSTAINYLKLKSGLEFDLRPEVGPFYMDGITLTAESLLMFKDMVTNYEFKESEIF
ncbi:hypothetical protein L1264_13695 [Pseudoalteromonas sp. APAL1]|uniref:hypothetical protein n=1 Tax=Pseudoalteromonas sp. APAL1 TaxID=2908883 RepID=UPI001F2889F0|nr:hypothetical protein [Pseudoalteromonas sp. APAL1]MCF2921528.1 hypothetical protein [Pseudoalteromonas sp. APAL1]